MAQETLKITITADNQQAVKNIQETVTATTNLGTAFKTLPNTSDRATNALSNLSRVTQDAPYGFIGIANNLNPLLESFQRLSKDAGGAGGALKAMAQGLMGPAGIGLALGAVSSILVAFGPKIADFISGTTAAEKAQSKLNDALAKSIGEAEAESNKLEILSSIVKDITKSNNERKSALERIQSTYKGNLELQKIDINDGQQLTQIINQVSEALKRKAMAQAFASLIAEEEAKKARLQINTLREMRDNVSGAAATWEFLKSAVKNAGSVMTAVDYNTKVTNKALDQNKLAIKEVDINLGLLNQQYKNVISDQIKFGDSTTIGTSSLKNQTKAVVGLKNELKDIGKQARPLGPDATNPILMQRGPAPTITSPTGNAPLGGRTSGYDAIKLASEVNEQTKAQELLNFQLQQTQSITGLLAPAFDSVIQAMVMGEDIGKTLEAAFKQIVIQLISMVAQALLFKAIMTAITGGGAAVGGAVSGGMGMGGGNFLGQFLLKGSDLVLATQRSNNNLNIRRGN
jgi:hypothetical protein